MRKKIQWMQIVRHLIQLISFILIPGLFLSIFLAIKDIFTAVTGGTFTLPALAPSLVLVITSMTATAIFGRFICGFFCSFGALQDLMWSFQIQTLSLRLHIPPLVDRILKYLKYVLLIGIIIFGWTLGLVDFEGSMSPFSVFGFYSSFYNWTNAQMLFTIGMIFLILIILGSMFIERFFCRYLCPLGGIFTLVSKIRFFKIKKKRSACGNCTLCTAKCSMGIPLNETDVVISGECIDCLRCVEVCPKHNVTANPKPAVASAIAIAASCGMIYGGNLLSDAIIANANNQVTLSSSADSSSSDYSVGNTSSAASSAESSDTGNKTTSSASESGTASQAESSTAASSEESSTAASSGTYTDGTYEGSGTGLRGTTSVSVTVSGGKIISVSIESYQDDREYFNRAKNSIISEILDAQSVSVNTVSGATFSSNGILEAVADALNIDFTNPNSSMQGGGHH